ncbi:PEP-CTERM sorting domain-containing protein [Massilia sp. TSP1-1-2]|uniref:PEP-CTERM sorting domain-containing protein n=1 Tax=unclassified Massilia TaxID=2609279 RepID=UPI003CFAC96F
MKLKQLCLAIGTALALSGAANAALLTGSTGSSANLVTDYSAPGMLSFDLDLHNFAATRFEFTIEDSDLIGPMSMNALVRNLSGRSLTNFSFYLEGIAFSSAGSVTPTFGTTSQINYTSTAAAITFATPEFAEFSFGNPFSLNNKSDWYFDTTGLRAGDAFSISATVPEPSTAMLMLSALAMFGGLYRRQRRMQP